MMGSQAVFYLQTAAFTFVSFSTITLIKYTLLDNGHALANIILTLGLISIRHLCIQKAERIQEGASLILFFLFDKNLLFNANNVLFLLGVVCVREQYQSDIVFREVVSFTSGLILMYFGWYSIGRIFVIYSLIYLLYLGLGFAFVVLMLLDWFKKCMNYIERKGSRKVKATILSEKYILGGIQK